MAVMCQISKSAKSGKSLHPIVGIKYKSTLLYTNPPDTPKKGQVDFSASIGRLMTYL